VQEKKIVEIKNEAENQPIAPYVFDMMSNSKENGAGEMKT
jgi:hypothetical protein